MSNTLQVLDTLDEVMCDYIFNRFPDRTELDEIMYEIVGECYTTDDCFDYDRLISELLVCENPDAQPADRTYHLITQEEVEGQNIEDYYLDALNRNCLV